MKRIVYLSVAAATAATLTVSAEETATLDLREYKHLESELEEAAKLGESLIDDEMLEGMTSSLDDEKFHSMAEEILEQSHTALQEQSDRIEYKEDSGNNTWAFEFHDEPVRSEPSFDQRAAQLDESSSLLGEAGDVRFVMFLSLGMPDPVLKQSLMALETDLNAVGVIQGLSHPDATIPETMFDLQAKVNQFDLPEGGPAMHLDPTLFDELGINQVPTLVRFDGKEPTTIVEGLPNVEWLERQYQGGETGELGQYGELFPIAEENLLDTIQRRVAELDKEEIVEGAADGVWDNHPMHPLPDADETDSFLVDLSISVDQDIRTPSGMLIASAGDTINPLHQVPFTQVGLVINGNDERHVEWANEQLDSIYASGRTPIAMTTHVDASEHGWDAYRSMNEAIPEHVTIVTQDILNRFGINSVPARFEQEGNLIRVTETALDGETNE